MCAQTDRQTDVLKVTAALFKFFVAGLKTSIRKQ